MRKRETLASTVAIKYDLVFVREETLLPNRRIWSLNDRVVIIGLLNASLPNQKHTKGKTAVYGRNRCFS